MYFSGRVLIDPAHATVIERHELKGPFKKLLNFLTPQDITPEKELETFSAVFMLRNLRQAFLNMGVTNLIRLAKNEVTFYIDEEGDEQDLDRAVEAFGNSIRPTENEQFDNLSLALEHRRDGLHYLLEIRVVKRHAVGEYPLKIKVNAFPELPFPESVSPGWVQEQCSTFCQNQEAFDAFLTQGRTAFNGFLESIEKQITNGMEVTDAQTWSSLRLIRPKQPVVDAGAAENLLKAAKKTFYPDGFDPDPIFGGYPRFQHDLFSSYQWAATCHQKALVCRDMEVVDEFGRAVINIGNAGLFAGATGTLNPESPFEPAKGGDLTYFDENSFFNEIGRLRLVN